MTEFTKQVRSWIERSKTEDDLVAILAQFTEYAKAKSNIPAKQQREAIEAIEKLAIKNGRAAGGTPSLGDIIMTEQNHKIAHYGQKTFCLSEKQMAVIIRENWGYLK